VLGDARQDFGRHAHGGEALRQAEPGAQVGDPCGEIALEVVDSRLAIGAAPGLGVEVDEEAVAAVDLRSLEAVPS
jgi:hypothetical protein